MTQHEEVFSCYRGNQRFNADAPPAAAVVELVPEAALAVWVAAPAGLAAPTELEVPDGLAFWVAAPAELGVPDGLAVWVAAPAGTVLVDELVPSVVAADEFLALAGLAGSGGPAVLDEPAAVVAVPGESAVVVVPGESAVVVVPG